MNAPKLFDVRFGACVGVAVFLLGWLLPNRVPPWPSFHNEAAPPIALALLGAWLLWRSKSPVRVPAAALTVALLASIPLLQWGFGLIRYAGDAMLAMIYLMGLAISIAIGTRWREVSPANAAQLVFTTLLLAAVLSTHLGLLQWMRSDLLGTLLADLPVGGRPNGNISQANHLASLQFLGLVSVWALYLRADTRGTFAWTAAAYLLFGMAMTQSRTGWLEVVTLAVAAIAWRRALGSRAYLPGLASLALLFVALVILWPAINQALYLDGGLTLADQTHAGRRPDAWLAMWNALLAAPWFGYGWTQVVLAQQAVAHLEPSLHVVFTYTHNLWLDLLIWNGIPLGAVAGALVCSWFWQQLLRAHSQDESLLLLALIGLLVHALFEFPHAYTYFLVPAGLMVGLLSTGKGLSMNRWAALASLLLAGVMFVVTVREYLTAEAAWLQVRMESARIRAPRDASIGPLQWLDQLQGLIDQSRMNPRSRLTVGEQAAFHRSVERFPASSSLFRLALMQAHHGRPTKAGESLQTLCSMSTPANCDRAINVWRAEAQSSAVMAAVTLPHRVVPMR